MDKTANAFVNYTVNLTVMSCMRAELLGSLGSSFDSAAHLANFFISVSPEAPIEDTASMLCKALQEEQKLQVLGLHKEKQTITFI